MTTSPGLASRNSGTYTRPEGPPTMTLCVAAGADPAAELGGAGTGSEMTGDPGGAADSTGGGAEDAGGGATVSVALVHAQSAVTVTKWVDTSTGGGTSTGGATGMGLSAGGCCTTSVAAGTCSVSWSAEDEKSVGLSANQKLCMEWSPLGHDHSDERVMPPCSRRARQGFGHPGEHL